MSSDDRAARLRQVPSSLARPIALAVAIACAAALSGFPAGVLLSWSFLVNIPREAPYTFVLPFGIALALWGGLFGYWYASRVLSSRPASCSWRQARLRTSRIRTSVLRPVLWRK